MKLLHTQRCPTAAKVQVHNLTNQRVYHSRPTTRKGGSRSGGRLLPEMRVSSTESLDYYEEYRSGKKVGTHPASSPRDSGQRRRAVDSSTSLDSHVTTVRGLIAGTGKRSELILLGVQGTAVGTDVPWTTMVALSPMSPMVGGASAIQESEIQLLQALAQEARVRGLHIERRRGEQLQAKMVGWGRSRCSITL
jgi:hypothetical protein